MTTAALPPPATDPRLLLQTARPAADLKAAKEAGQKFEAMVVGQMLESMFAGVGTGGIMGGGQAEATWRSFMLQEYGAAIAASGSLHIGDMVRADIARLNQPAEGPTP